MTWTAAEWWRCPNPACNALNHPTVTQCGLCHHPKPDAQTGGVVVNGPLGKQTISDDASAMKIRAESVGVPSRVNGLDGMGWAAKVVADPMRTLPPGAGFCIVRDLRLAIATACDMIETADARNLANDGPAGGVPPQMSLREWAVLYKTLKAALPPNV